MNSWPAPFCYDKMELQNKSSVWHSKEFRTWFSPSTFSRAVLLLSSLLSSLPFHDICFLQQLHSSHLKQVLKALISFQGTQKGPQGSWSWFSSTSDLWPNDFSFGLRMQRLSNLQKEGEREGMGKKIGMRGRMWGRRRIICHDFIFLHCNKRSGRTVPWFHPGLFMRHYLFYCMSLEYYRYICRRWSMLLTFWSSSLSQEGSGSPRRCSSFDSSTLCSL